MEQQDGLQFRGAQADPDGSENRGKRSRSWTRHWGRLVGGCGDSDPLYGKTPYFFAIRMLLRRVFIDAVGLWDGSVGAWPVA